MADTLRSRVTTAADAATDPAVKEDQYLAKVLRYIPGEIVAVYLTACGILTSQAGVVDKPALWVVVAVLAVVTLLWTLYAAGKRGSSKPLPWFQAFAALAAFIVWTFAIPQGPFTDLAWYTPARASLALVLVTFLMPLAERILVRPKPV